MSYRIQTMMQDLVKIMQRFEVQLCSDGVVLVPKKIVRRRAKRKKRQRRLS